MTPEAAREAAYNGTPVLSPDAAEWRANFERGVADGTLKIRPVREQLADVFEELGIK